MEVTLALAVGGIVLLLTRAVGESLMNSAATLAVVTVDAERAANGERILRGLVGRMEVTDTSRLFAGSIDKVEADSWCAASTGGWARCRITLRIRLDSLLLISDRGDSINLFGLTKGSEFRYLIGARDGGTMIRRWTGTMRLPIAIVIVQPDDTLFLPAGDRG